MGEQKRKQDIRTAEYIEFRYKEMVKNINFDLSIYCPINEKDDIIFSNGNWMTVGVDLAKGSDFTARSKQFVSSFGVDGFSLIQLVQIMQAGAHIVYVDNEFSMYSERDVELARKLAEMYAKYENYKPMTNLMEVIYSRKRASNKCILDTTKIRESNNQIRQNQFLSTQSLPRYDPD